MEGVVVHTLFFELFLPDFLTVTRGTKDPAKQFHALEVGVLVIVVDDFDGTIIDAHNFLQDLVDLGSLVGGQT